MIDSGASPERGTGEIPSSFVEFYRYWMPRLTGYLRSQTSDRRWIEDVAREAMLAAEAKWDDLMTYDRPGAWLFRVATTMLRRWQSNAREQCTSLDDMITRGTRTTLIADAGHDRTDGHLDLMGAMRTLPRRRREAIALHSLLGFPLADVAHIMGIAEGSAKTHVHRARTSLEEVLRAPRAATTREVSA